MPRLLLPVCGGLLAAASICVLADESSDPLPARVQRLVRQLDDDRIARRVAAEQQLVELGAAALPLLPDDSPRMSRDQRVRLRRVREKLQRAAAEQTVTASRVTLSGEMSFADAIAAIQRQTGNQIGGVHEGRGQVKVDFQQTPFWPALDQLLDQSDLDLQADYQPAGLAVSSRPDGQRDRYGAASYDEVFRLEPLRVQALRNLRTPELSGIQLAVRLSWEPRCEVIALQIPADALQARDDRQRSLTSKDTAVKLGVEVDGRSTIDMSLPLLLPPRDAKQIAQLSGEVEATVLGQNQEFVFTELSELEDVEQTKGAVTVVFEQFRKNLKLYEVRIRVRFDAAADSLASHRDWVSRNKAYVVDASGARLTPVAQESFLRSDDQIGRAYFFDLKKGPEGCRFIYETPGAVVRKTVRFQFEDIDLP